MAASAALLTLCLLVLFSNYVDREHTNNVKKSISTLYEDRLVVETYILKMTSDIYQIKEILNEPEFRSHRQDHRIAVLFSDINAVIIEYLETNLTASENIKLAALRGTLDEFKSSRFKGIELTSGNTNKALVLLSELSQIQIDESKLIMHRAEVLYTSGKVSTQFAFAISIIILLVLQAIVVASKPLSVGNLTSAPSLN